GQRLFALDSRNDRVGAGSHPMAFAIISPRETYKSFEVSGTPEEWRKFWNPANSDSAVRPIEFRKDIAWGVSASGSLSSEEFRIVTSDPAEKNLGADVDLVGPGPAYERFKKMPEYQQLQSDMKHVSSTAPQPMPNPFVVLAGQGANERQYDTLPDAVL